MLPCGFGNQAWLIETSGSHKETRTFINPLTTTANIEEIKIPEMEGQVCLARFQEWFFLVNDLSNDCFLLNIYSLTKIYLPSIEESSTALGKHVILTTCPSSPDCTVIFFGRDENFLLFCRPRDKEWTKLPVGLDVTQVHKMLMYKGELYVILLYCIQIIDLASLFKSFVKIRCMRKPYFSSFGSVRVEHLVESCGDLFFVQSCLLSIQTVSTIDLGIFKLDFTNGCNSWVRVENIEDRAFFLDHLGGQSFCAQDAQVNQNCIYHMVRPCYDGNRLYKICLGNQTTNFELLQEAMEDQSFFFWALPVRKPILKSDRVTSFETIVNSEICQKYECELKEHESEEGSFSFPLADVPIDVMQLISEKLPLEYSVRLRAVCKQWSYLLNPIKEEQVWLMYCPLKDGTCRMYNPFQGKDFELNLNKLHSDKPTRLLFSKDGWVLALEGDHLINLLNPFTNDIHYLPRLDYIYSKTGIAFSSAPSSSNCVIFAIVSLFTGEVTYIMTWHYGQQEWVHMKFNNEYPFHLADNNPVFIDEEFYCLGKRGDLGVFNPENHTWRIINNLSPIYSKAPEIGKDKDYCYLLECNSELIAVFQAIDMDDVHVYKLNRSQMIWTHLENLGDLTLFLDFRTSIARALPCKKYSNKLYLPRLTDRTCKDAFYYCMKTKRNNPNFKRLSAPYNCVWLVPNLMLVQISHKLTIYTQSQ